VLTGKHCAVEIVGLLIVTAPENWGLGLIPKQMLPLSTSCTMTVMIVAFLVQSESPERGGLRGLCFAAFRLTEARILDFKKVWISKLEYYFSFNFIQLGQWQRAH